MIVRSPFLLILALLLLAATPYCVRGYPMFLLGVLKTRCISVTAPQDTVLKVSYDAPGKSHTSPQESLPSLFVVVVVAFRFVPILLGSSPPELSNFCPRFFFGYFQILSVRWSKPNFLEQEKLFLMRGSCGCVSTWWVPKYAFFLGAHGTHRPLISLPHFVWPMHVFKITPYDYWALY